MNIFKAQHAWLENSGREKAILFFAGWGLSPSLWAHLEAGDSDVLVFYDYGNASEIPDLSAYKRVTIMGYSMGVLMATAFCSERMGLPVDDRIAFCGSVLPVSTTFGIELAEYTHFIDNMSPALYKEFLFKVAGDILQYRKIAPKALPYQQKERSESLAYILSVQEKSFPPIAWNHIALCKNDLVFPVNKLQSFWSGMNVIPILLEESHFPFFRWHSWEELLLTKENKS